MLVLVWVGKVGLKMCSERGVVFWLVWSCSCGACAPFPLCFWLVGGGAPVGTVRAGDVGLCVVQERGLSPRTPVEAVQGCPPVGVDARRRMGFFCSRR